LVFGSQTQRLDWVARNLENAEPENAPLEKAGPEIAGPKNA